MNPTTTLDFAELVKTTPTSISTRFQGQLAAKLAESFTSEEEKWYVASFYAYSKFHPVNDYVIDLEKVFEMIGFSTKGSAKRTLQKYFKIDKDYKVLLNQSVKQTKRQGGSNQENVFLNINTFKHFCLLAQTAKGEQIRDYYVKLETIIQDIVVVQNEENLLQMAKKDALIEAKEQENQQLQQEKKLEKHNLLLREFAVCSAMIYIIKVKSYEDGSYVVKIGESRQGIAGRFKEHSNNYEQCEVLDCFKVRNSKKFEKFIHEHLRFQRVNDLENHEKETELFLIGGNSTYKKLLDTIEENIKHYQDDSMEILRLENELLEMRTNVSRYQDLKEVVETLAIVNRKLDNIEVRLDNLEPLIISRTAKLTTNFSEPSPHIGPRLQQINPETLQLVKVYETTTELFKIDSSMKRPSIAKAVKENTIYNGFRWNFVDRHLNANVVENLPATKITRLQNLGYIAKLNADKSQILSIYLDRKTASNLNGYRSPASLDVVVKKTQLSNGNYYILYETLSQNLKDSYAVKNPILYRDGVGKFDSDGNLVREFTCKNHCIRSGEMSEKSLAKALKTGMAYSSYFYRFIGEKLHC